MSKAKEYWQPGTCPKCGDVTVRIKSDKWANVVARECVQCGRDLRVTA
jgi:Zn ribbon nucleic-acid-binding protein